jgi:hypothetical protein
MKKLFSSLAIVALISISSLQAQTLTIPRPSPTVKVEQEFGTSKIWLEYSRPSVKGRVIFGELVPFDKVWRTGANSSTKIKFGSEVKVEGNVVPAGKYALLTIPGKEQWTIILSKDTLAAIDEYKQENDFLRFTVKPTALPFSLETFTIDFGHLKPSSCYIDLLWDKTMVRVSVTEEIDAKIMKQIDNAMNVDTRPYWQAANYYFENGKDITQAYAWVNKALETRPEAYWMFTAKAKMELKMGKYKEAVATAEHAKALAFKDNDTSYVQQNDKTIAEAKSKM